MKNIPIIAIVGLPNVGKSSLFNRLVGRRQAIVAKKAGTTRDPVKNLTEWGGKHFWLIDTAGLEKAADQPAASAQDLINESIDSADVIVMVVAANQPVTNELRAPIKQAFKAGKPLVLAVNKIDTTKNQLPAEFHKLGLKTVIGTSAIHASGAAELLDEIIKLIPKKAAALAGDLAPQMALVGRPNVGKSSIFNKLVGGGKAIVTNEPGTTRDVNAQTITYNKQPYVISDTAGIRRPGKIKNIEHFSWLRTLEAINAADVAILVMDATEPSVAVDQKIAGIVKEAGKGLIIAINKWDQVNQDESAQAGLMALLQRDFAHAWWAPVVLTSAATGHNIPKLLKIGSEVLDRRTQKISTKELNKVLQAAMAAHPPAGLKNRHPKLNYVTQTGVNPPQFSLFGAHLEFLHWSYKRYLEKQIREAWDFTGTPIELVYKSKHKEKQ